MSGGEPSSIKRKAVCAVRVPDLSRLLLHRAYRMIRGEVCSLAKDRFLFACYYHCFEIRTERLILYEALYRKYRPKTFDEVVGQPFITETLKTQVRTGRLSHAYLFIGTRGTGKTTCARILAKAVNCEHPVDGNPCNECAACRGIEDGTILDVSELDAASNNGVDDVRMLRDEAVFSPTTVRKRVYIIDEVHMLSKPAFNALLKILEEPPQHLMFILATTELNKVLPTILSRCQRHSFRRLDSDTIAKRLSYVAGEEHINLTEDAAQLLGRLADGGMRDGLSLLDQCSAAATVDTDAVRNAMGLAGTARTEALANAILSGSTEETLTQFEGLWQEGKDPAALLNELSGLFRDAMLLHLAPKGGSALVSGAFDISFLQKMQANDDTLLWYLDTLQKHQGQLRESGNPRLQAELCLAELSRGYISVSAVPPKKTDAPQARPPKAENVSSSPRVTSAEKAVQYAEAASTESPVKSETIREKPLSKPAPAEDEPRVSDLSGSKPEASEISSDFVVSQLSGDDDFPMGVRIVLMDSTQCTAEISGSEFILHVQEGFPKMQINVPDITNKIRQKTSAICGKPMQIRIESYQPQATNEVDKLGALGKFGNVTIQ